MREREREVVNEEGAVRKKSTIELQWWGLQGRLLNMAHWEQQKNSDLDGLGRSFKLLAAELGGSFQVNLI